MGAQVRDLGSGSQEIVFPMVIPDDNGKGRISTVSAAGSAIAIPAAHTYGEGWELRYSCSFTASQFQGIYMQVAAAVANTGSIRGAELDARNASALNVGTLEGLFGQATVKGAATITNAFGVSGQVGLPADTAATVTFLAALRGKVQSEDAATITEGYGLYLENEAVTGIKLLTAAVGVKSTSGAIGFGVLIDASGTQLTNQGSNKVTLIKFKDSANVTKSLNVNSSGTVSVD